MYRKLLLLLASIALVSAQSPTSESHTSANTSISPNATTTVAPTTTNKTEPPKTTTTTPTPTTTTKSTTTVAPPTPPPVPKPAHFNGNVTEGKITCINVDFSVQITIKYNNTDNKEMTTGFTLSSNATVDNTTSHCSVNKSEPQVIAIDFANDEMAKMTLTFNTSKDHVFVEDVMLSFVATPALMPGLDTKLYNKSIVASNNNLNLFNVATARSYLCNAAQPAKLDSHDPEHRITDVLIDFTDSKVEAYIDEKNKGQFDSAIDCKSADISDVVPIAVGAALAGLVIIVLIAYFVGRRRSRRLAYQSV